MMTDFMHSADKNTVWHSYAKVRAGICYGIITKRVDGVVVLSIKETFKTRKDAKRLSALECKRLIKEQQNDYTSKN